VVSSRHPVFCNASCNNKAIATRDRESGKLQQLGGTAATKQQRPEGDQKEQVQHREW